MFAVFRRYQRTLMAGLALFAMVAFTLDFSLLRFGGGPQNPVVVELYGQKVRQSDLDAMIVQRSLANRFMTLIGAQTQYYFGGLDSASIVDALILQHEAEEMGLPADRELAIRWLQQNTDGVLNAAMFDQTYRQNFASEVTDVQLLEAIANQIRLRQVRTLPGLPTVTPLDVYQTYREQNERVSAKLVAFPASDFIEQVPMPSDAEARAYFEKYKDVEPDPARETPGFKVPRKIVAEFAVADVPALADAIEPTLTEAELREFFNENRDEFFLAEPELPTAVFAGDPGLTPSLRDEFREVRDQVAQRLARRRAEEQVQTKVDAIEAEIAAFNDAYFQARDEAEQAGRANPTLPSPGDLFEKAARAQGLEYEKTPPLERAAAEQYGRIGSATIGGGPFDPGVRFSEEFFDPDRRLYETVVLADPLGRQYLAWKVDDQPARTPRFEDVKDEVVLAWRLEEARDLAAAAARAFAQKVREGTSIDQAAQAETKTVVTTTPVARLVAGLPNPMNPFQLEPPRPSEIPQVPDAGQAFRDAYFALGPNSVEVVPNAPRTIYYVMARDALEAVTLQGLYDPYQGQRISLQNEVLSGAYQRRDEQWMQELRARAGLDPNWVPLEQRQAERREG